MTQDVGVLRTAPADLPASLRDVVEYRKSGLSLNHVVGCPLDCAYCVRHLFDNYDMKRPHLVMDDEAAVVAGITSIVSRIHGIWERDVADAPEIEDVIDDVFEWLEDAPIVGHNVRVELEIIGRAMEDWQPSAAFDTLRIARRLVPNEKKHGLEHLGSKLGLLDAAGAATGGGSHSAPFDAALSAILLEHLLAPLSEAERQAVMDDADILRVQQGSLL